MTPPLFAAERADAPAGFEAWLIDLDRSAPGEAAAWLSRAERDRAARFRLDIHRDRFIVGRCFMRHRLSMRTKQAPVALEIVDEAHGKPRLHGARGCAFNLSHCGHLGLFAMGGVQPIGVDIERLRSVPDAVALAERFFAPAESARVRALDGPRRSEAFLHCWTGKEACLKALGVGLVAEPNSFELPDGADAVRVVVTAAGVAVSLALQWRRQPGWIAAFARVEPA